MLRAGSIRRAGRFDAPHRKLLHRVVSRPQGGPRCHQLLMRRLQHLVLCLAAALLAAVLAMLGASPASAHNSLEGSDPADGAVLAVAPAQVSFDFKAAVPLDTASVQVIDASGARTDATLGHGATDDVLVATLPPLAVGETVLRWRLVGPDGHPLTGRVALTVSPPATAAPPATTTPGAVAAPPATTTSPPPTSAPVDTGAVGVEAGRQVDDSLPVPDALRWVLRYGSYLAVMAIIGIVLVDRCVWRGAASDPMLRRPSTGHSSRWRRSRCCNCSLSRPTSPTPLRGLPSGPSMPR